MNAYSELIDPVDQAQRFEDQAKAKEGGDSDAHAPKMMNSITALNEYGCLPAAAGAWVLTALLRSSQQENLRDVVLFPLMETGARGANPKFKNQEPNKERKRKTQNQKLPRLIKLPCNPSTPLPSSPARRLRSFICRQRTVL